MKTSVLVLLVAVVACASMAKAQIPIPSRPLGLAEGSPTAPVVIEMFLDPLCPDSAAAWPVVRQVVESYGGDKVRFVVHVFPLPYHQFSFIASQGALVIRAGGAGGAGNNVTAAIAWIDSLFTTQSPWYNGPTSTQTANQVISALGAAAESAGLISQSAFVAGIADGSLNEDTRIAWKYGCSLGVSGTPTFFVNGVQVQGAGAWTVQDWQSVLNPLFAPAWRSAATGESANEARRAAYFKAVDATATETARAYGLTGDNEGMLVLDCPAGRQLCQYLPGKTECCFAGEMCIPNVGCSC